MSRCPNGSRKNKKTGECVKKKFRCPNGSRKNKKTKLCEKNKKKLKLFLAIKLHQKALN
jgi:hypothetical protein